MSPPRAITGILATLMLLWPSAAVIAGQGREPGFVAGLPAGTLTVEALPVPLARLPKGALRVPMLQLQLSASCEADITVTSITVKREGLGLKADLTGVYLVLGAARISGLQRLTSKDERVVLRPRSLSVPACGERSVSVAADFSRSAESGSQHRFALESRESLETSAAIVEGAFPLRSQPERAVTPKERGQISSSFNPPDHATRTGKQLLQKFRLHLSGQDDHALVSITLSNEGTAHDADLRNLHLKAHGRRVTATVPELLGRDVTLRFDPPHTLRARKEYLFELHGDVWRKAKTFDFTVEEEADVVTEVLPGRRKGGGSGGLQ